MKKLYFVAVISLVALSSLFAQEIMEGLRLQLRACENCLDPNLVQEGEVLDMGTRNIISDFGPRNLSGTRWWHGGVDYTVEGAEDQGYHILSIEAGMVTRIRGDNGQKYPQINGNMMHLMYNHAFTDASVNSSNSIRQGNVELVRLTSPRDAPSSTYIYGVLHYRPGIDTILIAACQNNDCTQSYYIKGTDTIRATNQVAAGQVIGSVGTSGGVPSHVHLQRFRSSENAGFYNKSNLIDPLEEVWHQQPKYAVKLYENTIDTSTNDYTEGIKIRYPGSLASKILVRPIMPDSIDGMPNNGIAGNFIFVNNTLNIDRVDLLAGRQGQELQLIQGKNHESKIWFGARYDFHEHYPTSPDLMRIENEGSWTKHGVKPYAYSGREGGRRWDEYYFPDFITRIHRDAPISATATTVKIAHRPSDARYNDGPYQMMAKVTTVRDSIFTSDTLDFVLDNFKPYVESVSASVGDLLFYQRGWEAGAGSSCNGIQLGALAVNGVTLSYEDILTNGWTISAKVSEPLQQLTLSVLYENEACSPSCVDDLQAEWSDDGLTATFHVDGTTARTFCESSTGVKFQFSGYDYPVSPAEIKQGKIALPQGLSSGIYLVRVQLEDNSIHLRRIAIQ